MGVRQVLVHQEPHGFCDPPSTDLVLGKVVHGISKVSWRYRGDPWITIPARRPGHIGISPLDTVLEMDVAAAQTVQITTIPISTASSLLQKSGLSGTLDFGDLQGPTYWRDAFVSGVLDEIWKASHYKSPITDCLIDSLTQTLLIKLEALSAAPPHKPKKPVQFSLREMRLIHDLIDAGSEKPLTVDELSKALGLSIRDLHRRCVATTGLPPHRYIVMRRLERAKSALHDKNRSLAAIAIDFGFCDQSHFTRVFKDYKGVTPGEYRRSI